MVNWDLLSALGVSAWRGVAHLYFRGYHIMRSRWWRWLFSALFMAAIYYFFIVEGDITYFAEYSAGELAVLIIAFILLTMLVRLVIGNVARLMNNRRSAQIFESGQCNQLRLPWRVKSARDIDRLLSTFGLTAAGNKRVLRTLFSEIGANERLYYIGASNITIKRGKQEAVVGALFISDSRVVVQGEGLSVGSVGFFEEYPLKEIYTVGAESTSLGPSTISFSTDESKVSFIATYHVAIAKGLRQVFINAIITAGGDVDETITEVVDVGVGQALPSVVECRGCGATVVVRPGRVSECKYCGRHKVGAD